MVETGSHFNALTAVAQGCAQAAGVDAVTWNLLAQQKALPGDLRVIARTPACPGLPYVTSLTHDPEMLRQAVETAIQKMAPSDRDLLPLRNLIQIPAEVYLSIPTPPPPHEIAAVC